MLGNQESQGEPQDKLANHLEPDQEVAAVLATGERQIYINHVQFDTTGYFIICSLL